MTSFLRSEKLMIAALWSVAILLGGAYFSRAMTAEWSHDEHHYVGAGVLLTQATPYRDFAHLQTPYLAYIYRVVFWFPPEGFFFLKARIVNFLFLVLCCFLVFTICKRLARDSLSAVALTFLFVCSGIIQESAPHADNNIPALTFLLAGVRLLILAFDRPSSGAPAAFAAGLFMALSAGTKMFYAPFFVAGAFLLVCPAPDLWTKYRKVFAFVLGAVIGFLPIFFLAFMAPSQMFFDNVAYHRLTTLFLRNEGMDPVTGIRTTLHFLKRLFLLHLDNGVVVLAGLGACFAFWKGKGDWFRPLFVILMGISAIAILVVPRPLYTQHVVLLLPPVLFFAAAGCGHLTDVQKKIFGLFLLILCLISWVSSGTALLAPLGNAWKKPWPPLETARASTRIKAHLPEGGRVATLSPLYALEAGLPVYRQLATGVFMYRISSYLSWEEQTLFVSVSPDRLALVLTADKPAAIVTGFEGKWDARLEAFALKHGYVQVEENLMGARLFVRKDIQ